MAVSRQFWPFFLTEHASIKTQESCWVMLTEEVHNDGAVLQKAAYLKTPDRLSAARTITESQKPSLKWAKYCGRSGRLKKWCGVVANLFSKHFSALFTQCLHITKKAVSARECRSTARRAGSAQGSLTQHHSSICWICIIHHWTMPREVTA